MNLIKPILGAGESGFRLEEYFDGRSRADGIYEDRFGNVRRSFTVTIEGLFDGTVLTLDESFTFDDGSTDGRLWKVTPLPDGVYEGRAEDVIGRARGEINGNRLSWHYDMMLPVRNRRIRVRFDDQMWLLSDGLLLNRARISKFGILLGTVTIVFTRESDILSDWRVRRHGDTQDAAIAR